MTNFTHLKRCLEIGEREVAAAVATRDACKDLLDHLTVITRPKDGAPKILIVFGRMATTACDWIEGDLRIEVMGDGDVTVIEIMSELGPGLRERIFAAFGLNVPFDEFTRAIERVPALMEPLTLASKTTRRLIFVASAASRRTSNPPPPVQIDSGSFFPPPPSPDS